MKSTYANVGSMNLKGKKSKHLGCGCCTAQNFKEREMERAGLKQIRDFDIGEKISEETEKNLKTIDDNIRYALMNGDKFYCD